MDPRGIDWKHSARHRSLLAKETRAERNHSVLFALDNEGAVRDQYVEGHPALKDRVMFVTVAPEHPAAAWFKVNDPIKDFDKIQRLVKDGFLVRTRADADTRQARTGDITQRDKAFSSGAQYISTDYHEPDRRFSD